jgi:hypothetical protein
MGTSSAINSIQELWPSIRERREEMEKARRMPGDLPEDDDERRRYFSLTALGDAVAVAEARRLEAAVMEARAKRLLAKRG